MLSREPIFDAQWDERLPLNNDQLQGISCVVCSESHRVMVPVPGVESPQSAQLFRCRRRHCEISAATLESRVAASTH